MDKYKLQHLNQFIAEHLADQHIKNLDYLKGFYTAACSSPSAVYSVDTAFELFEENESIDLWLNDNELHQAWMALVDDIESQLVLGKLDLVSAYGELLTPSKDMAALQAWAKGYLYGYLVTEASWDKAYQLFVDTVGLPLAEPAREKHLALLSALTAIAGSDNDSQPSKDQVAVLLPTATDAVRYVFKLALVLNNKLYMNKAENETTIQQQRMAS